MPEPVKHYVAYGATNAFCDETVPRSVRWDPFVGDCRSPRFTTRQGEVTCPDCAHLVRVRFGPLVRAGDLCSKHIGMQILLPAYRRADGTVGNTQEPLWGEISMITHGRKGKVKVRRDDGMIDHTLVATDEVHVRPVKEGS